MTCKPGHPGRHEDFAEANEAATKHGGRSERRWRPLAEKFAAELVEVAPWTAAPAHRATVAAWARVEAQLALVADFLDAEGLLDADGLPRPATGFAARLEARAMSLRGELGLSPLSLARLLGMVAVTADAVGLGESLDALRLEGRRILEARAAAEAEDRSAVPARPLRALGGGDD